MVTDNDVEPSCDHKQSIRHWMLEAEDKGDSHYGGEDRAKGHNAENGKGEPPNGRRSHSDEQ